MSSSTIGELRFLYVGVDDTAAALAFYVEVLGATLRWRFQAFESDVAAVELGHGPLVLLADHRDGGSVLPIYAVDSLSAATNAVVERGGRITDGPPGTPEGDVVVVTDPAGNRIAFLQVERPGAMDRAYADETNDHAVR